jgi:hypothetical protein
MRAEFSRENAMAQDFCAAAEKALVNTGVSSTTFRNDCAAPGKI